MEALDESGPLGLPAISVAHYYEQNGDPMRDPEMCFEIMKPIGGTLSLKPFYSRFAYVSISRASHDAQIYTDDAASLASALSHDIAKTSAVSIEQGVFDIH